MTRRPKANYLRQVRDRLGLTQVEMADQLGLEVGTISRMERGVIPLRPVLILALATLVAKHTEGQGTRPAP